MLFSFPEARSLQVRTPNADADERAGTALFAVSVRSIGWVGRTTDVAIFVCSFSSAAATSVMPRNIMSMILGLINHHLSTRFELELMKGSFAHVGSNKTCIIGRRRRTRKRPLPRCN